jgi:hypothetical protein
MKKTLKNKILLGITETELIVTLVMTAAIDSPDPRISIILLAQAMAWLALFNKANPNWSKDL